jgi:hypothetical protein
MIRCSQKRDWVDLDGVKESDIPLAAGHVMPDWMPMEQRSNGDNCKTTPQDILSSRWQRNWVVTTWRVSKICGYFAQKQSFQSSFETVAN